MKIVILERDGVINQDSGAAIRDPEDWVPIPGSLEAIATLNQSGYRVVVTSCHADLATGKLDIDALNAIHRKMHDELDSVGGHVDGVFFCPHAPSQDCDCRNPDAGLLHEIADRFGVVLRGVPVVSPCPAHLEPALPLGIAPFLVKKSASTQESSSRPDPDIPAYPDLRAVVEAILVQAQ